MAKPMIQIHDVETNEVIEREMTTAEFNQYKKDQEIDAAREAAIDLKAKTKSALLDRLGITEDEAKLLLG